MRSEKLIQGDIMRYLKTVRPSGYFFKVPAGPWSMAGIADIVGCYKGKFVAIEVKSKAGKMSRVQTHFKRCIELAGGLFLVARSVNDVKGSIYDRSSNVGKGTGISGTRLVGGTYKKRRENPPCQVEEAPDTTGKPTGNKKMV